jgi:hypothetical protein
MFEVCLYWLLFVRASFRIFTTGCTLCFFIWLFFLPVPAG